VLKYQNAYANNHGLTLDTMVVSIGILTMDISSRRWRQSCRGSSL
jgi:hypothetical protein